MPIHLGNAKHPDERQPEQAVRGEGRGAEHVVLLVLLEGHDDLGEAAVEDGHGEDHRAHAEQAGVAQVEEHRGDAERHEPERRRVGDLVLHRGEHLVLRVGHLPDSSLVAAGTRGRAPWRPVMTNRCSIPRRRSGHGTAVDGVISHEPVARQGRRHGRTFAGRSPATPSTPRAPGRCARPDCRAPGLDVKSGGPPCRYHLHWDQRSLTRRVLRARAVVWSIWWGSRTRREGQ